MAPVGSSRTHRLVELISKIDTVLLVVAGILCATLVPILNFEANFKYIYLGAILITISGSFAYKQASSFAVLSGVAKAFSKNIVI